MTEINSLDTRKAVEYYGAELKKGGDGDNPAFYCCPIHGERTPSLAVYPDGHWHCYGACSDGGNAIKYIMMLKNITFPMALQEAEKIYGVKLNFDNSREKFRPLYEANSAVSELFHNELKSKKAILSYLAERGLDKEAIEYWGVGYALEEHTLGRNDDPDRFDKYELYARAGLLTVGDRYNAVFNGRITFPITDMYGNILGFTARVDPTYPKDLQEKLAKYKNTPGTEIYQKKKTVFGYGSKLNDLIKKEKLVMVGEGAMDAVVPQQKGVPSTALLGLGSNDLEALEPLSRLTKTIVFCFDGDTAGYTRAFSLSVQGIFKFIENHPDVIIRMAFLPEGYDPDEFVLDARYGAKKLLEILRTAPTAEQYVINKILSDGEAIVDAGERRAWFYQNHVKTMQNLPSVIRRSLLSMIQSKLGLEIDEKKLEKTTEKNEAVIVDRNAPMTPDDSYCPPDVSDELPMDFSPDQVFSADSEMENNDGLSVVTLNKAPSKSSVKQPAPKSRYPKFSTLTAISRSSDLLETANKILEEAGLPLLKPDESIFDTTPVLWNSFEKLFIVEYQRWLSGWVTIKLKNPASTDKDRDDCTQMTRKLLDLRSIVDKLKQ